MAVVAKQSKDIELAKAAENAKVKADKQMAIAEYKAINAAAKREVAAVEEETSSHAK
jgi:hypothetical protein